MIKARAVLRRGWAVLLAGLVLGLVAGAASSAMAPKPTTTPTYRAAQIVVANRASAQPGNVEQDALRVTRGTVAEKAAEALGEPSARRATGGVSAEADVDSGSIEITATDKDPAVAAQRVDAFVKAFLTEVNADLLADQDRRIAELQSQVDDANRALKEFDAAHPNLNLLSPTGNEVAYRMLVDQRTALVSQVRSARDQLQQERVNLNATLPYSSLGADPPAKVDTELLPVPTSMPFRMGLLGVFGLVLAAGVVMVIERMRPRIDTHDELAAAVDFPVLAEVGLVSRRHMPHESDDSLRLEGAWAEPYRRIRSAIQYVRAAAPGDPPKVFMFTSPSAGEGKSTTTALTAIAMAETGQPTLVIGGDFRRPAIHELLGTPGRPGIREHARLDLDRPAAADILYPTAHPRLFVAPAGAPGKEVVGLAGAAQGIAKAGAREGAVVMIDTSPVEAANDTIDLLPAVDEVIIVVRSGRTTRRTLTHTVEILRQHGASIMGTALIATPGFGRQYYYYEGYLDDDAHDAGGPGEAAGLHKDGEDTHGAPIGPTPAEDASSPVLGGRVPSPGVGAPVAPAPAPRPPDGPAAGSNGATVPDLPLRSPGTPTA